MILVDIVAAAALIFLMRCLLKNIMDADWQDDVADKTFDDYEIDN